MWKTRAALSLMGLVPASVSGLFTEQALADLHYDRATDSLIGTEGLRPSLGGTFGVSKAIFQFTSQGDLRTSPQGFTLGREDSDTPLIVELGDRVYLAGAESFASQVEGVWQTSKLAAAFPECEACRYFPVGSFEQKILYASFDSVTMRFRLLALDPESLLASELPEELQLEDPQVFTVAQDGKSQMVFGVDQALTRFEHRRVGAPPSVVTRTKASDEDDFGGDTPDRSQTWLTETDLWISVSSLSPSEPKARTWVYVWPLDRSLPNAVHVATYDFLVEWDNALISGATVGVAREWRGYLFQDRGLIALDVGKWTLGASVSPRDRITDVSYSCDSFKSGTPSNSGLVPFGGSHKSSFIFQCGTEIRRLRQAVPGQKTGWQTETLGDLADRLQARQFSFSALQSDPAEIVFKVGDEGLWFSESHGHVRDIPFSFDLNSNFGDGVVGKPPGELNTNGITNWAEGPRLCSMSEDGSEHTVNCLDDRGNVSEAPEYRGFRSVLRQGGQVIALEEADGRFFVKQLKSSTWHTLAAIAPPEFQLEHPFLIPSSAGGWALLGRKSGETGKALLLRPESSTGSIRLTSQEIETGAFVLGLPAGLDHSGRLYGNCINEREEQFLTRICSADENGPQELKTIFSPKILEMGGHLWLVETNGKLSLLYGGEIIDGSNLFGQLILQDSESIAKAVWIESKGFQIVKTMRDTVTGHFLIRGIDQIETLPSPAEFLFSHYPTVFELAQMPGGSYLRSDAPLSDTPQLVDSLDGFLFNLGREEGYEEVHDIQRVTDESGSTAYVQRRRTSIERCTMSEAPWPRYGFLLPVPLHCSAVINYPGLKRLHFDSELSHFVVAGRGYISSIGQDGQSQVLGRYDGTLVSGVQDGLLWLEGALLKVYSRGRVFGAKLPESADLDRDLEKPFVWDPNSLRLAHCGPGGLEIWRQGENSWSKLSESPCYSAAFSDSRARLPEGAIVMESGEAFHVIDIASGERTDLIESPVSASSTYSQIGFDFDGGLLYVFGKQVYRWDARGGSWTTVPSQSGNDKLLSSPVRSLEDGVIQTERTGGILIDGQGALLLRSRI